MEISITITEVAKAHILELLKKQPLFDAKFRLYVSLSRANGFEYACTFDDLVNDDDLVLNYQVQDKNFDILIDSMSFQYINGAFVDCKTHEGQEGLIISNPNAGKVEGENAV